jgi:transposase-like protein
MSQRYDPGDRMAALYILRENGGNIRQTSRETGIPARTLYAWRKQEMQELQQFVANAPSPPPPQIPPDFDPDDQDTLLDLRRQLLYHVASILPTLSTGVDLATPYQRALTLRSLLEQVRLLDELMPPPPEGQIIMVQYTYPDGSVHDKPIWESDWDDEHE